MVTKLNAETPGNKVCVEEQEECACQHNHWCVMKL